MYITLIRVSDALIRHKIAPLFWWDRRIGTARTHNGHLTSEDEVCTPENIGNNSHIHWV
jgi:hypothetical protein